MAHKKAQWSTNNGRDSNAKRLWVKVFWGLEVRSGNIIIRQKWNKFWPWEWVSQGKDFTLFAVKDWIVSFQVKRKVRFDWRIFRDIYVSVK
jgi:large subunit ribosomal protein L27